MKNLIKLSAILMAFSWAGLAQAGHSGCVDEGYDYTGGVTLNVGCALGHSNNDAPHPDTVNSESMFGGGWTYGGKYEANRDGSIGAFESGDVDVGFMIKGDDISGTWEVIANLWDLYDEVMIVLKSGNGQVPDVYVGYLIKPGETMGDYLSIFSGGEGGISHWSIYVRGPKSVPEPGTMALLGLGLVGIGLTRRRKKR